MASRCTCDRIEAMLEGTPWFKTLPGGARWLCFQLVKLMATASYGGAIPFSDTRRVSLLVSMDGTEVETQMETLIETGLLARDERGHLSCPILGEVAARTMAARQNGARGGRPRRGETPEQAAARRAQGELLMPVPGRAAKPTGNPSWETASAGTTTRLSTERSSAADISDDAPWKSVRREMVEIAGLSTALSGIPVRQAMAAGMSAEALLDAARRVAARPGYSPTQITGLGYFVRVAESPASGGVEARDAPRIVHSEPTEFEMKIRAWKEGGYQGPPPRRQQHAA